MASRRAGEHREPDMTIVQVLAGCLGKQEVELDQVVFCGNFDFSFNLAIILLHSQPTVANKNESLISAGISNLKISKQLTLDNSMKGMTIMSG